MERYKVPLVYLLSLAYVAMNAYMIYKDMYWSLMLPLFLVMLWFYIYRLDVIMLLIVALTPVAVNVVQFELGAGSVIPTEPLLFGVLVIFILKLFYNNDFDPKVWKHPLSVLVLVQLAWMLITSSHKRHPAGILQIPAFPDAGSWYRCSSWPSPCSNGRKI